MERIALGAGIGAIFGGILGFVGDVMKRNKESSYDLGHDWNYIKNDRQLNSLLHNMKSFRNADGESYHAICESCDNLISLWLTVMDPNSNPQYIWTYKAFKYVKTIEQLLNNISLSIPRMRRTSRRSRDARCLGTSDDNDNMYEFHQYADSLCEIVRNYYHNILNEMQFRYSPEEN